MAQDRDQLAERVREIMAETFDVPVDDVPEDVNEHNYAPWNSLANLTLTVALEENFGITFSITDLNRMSSLSKIVDILQQHGVAVRP